MKNFVCTLLAGASLAFPSLAAAQEQTASQPAADEVSSTDIVVTAQRRSERLQDIPATISALDSQSLKAAGVLDISNIAPRVPGFYAGGFGASRPQLYIRGIGTRQFDPGSESSVGVFVDESYLGRTGGVLGVLKDIERVEVLKGPQGTLYGRNTIGGAVNVITKGPTSDFHAEGEATVGNYNNYELFAAVSGPVAGDAVKARIAGWRAFRDGYLTNLTTGNHPQGLDNYGGRARFELNPLANLKIDLIAEIMRDTGPSFQGVSVGSPANPNGILLAKAGVAVAQKSADRFAQFYTTDAAYNRHIDSFTGKIALDLTGGTFVSVTSYRKMKYKDDRDFDNTNLDVIRQISDENSKQFTQELRFVSAKDGPLSLGGRVDWILGAFYYKDTSFHQDTFRFGPDSSPGALAPQVDTTYGNYKTESFAAFGQAAIHVTSTVDLTLGGRYTEDRKQATLGGTTTDTAALVRAPFVANNPKVKFRSFDPRVVLSWQPTRDLNFYASWSRGFKSGGYQYTPLTLTQAQNVFRPEKLDAYEVGVKSVWLDGAARINAAYFHYDYKNLQVSSVVQLPDGSTPTLISNAATSKVDGAELDVTLEPTKGLTFNIGYAYTKAKYSTYLGPAGVNFSNTPLVRAPKHSVNLVGQYTFAVGNDTDVTLRGDYALLSEFNHEPIPADPTKINRFTLEEGYGLGNARIAVRHGAFTVAGWVQNVFDTTYRRSVLALPGQLISIYGMPRTYGATLGFAF